MTLPKVLLSFRSFQSLKAVFTVALGCSMQLREQICELGEAGAKKGRPLVLTPAQMIAAEWMEKYELASVNGKGRLVINSAALIFSTRLSSPKKVQDPVDPLCRSLWSLRRSLVTAGWSKGESGKHASVAQRCFNFKSEHHAYYTILLKRALVFIVCCKLQVSCNDVFVVVSCNVVFVEMLCVL